MTGMILPLLLAASVLLPAAPRAMAVGDLDGDGSPEIVVLLTWPRWGSAMRDVAEAPGVSEIEVVPAVEERREIRAFRLTGDRLVPAARPLPVGPEVLALGAGARDEPVFALTEEGLARLVLDRAGAGTTPGTLHLAPVLAVDHLLAGSRTVFATIPFVRDLDGRPPAEALVARPGELLLLGPGGLRGRLPSPVARTEGVTGRIAIPVPVDVDRDGTGDLLEWLPGSASTNDPAPSLGRVSFRRGRGPLAWDPPRTWDLDPLVAHLLSRKDEGGRTPDAMLAGVADFDGDGTLEAALERRTWPEASARKMLRWARAAPATFEFYPLRWNGKVDERPRWTLEVTGIDYPFVEHGPRSPFADLDGDGRPELVTVDLGIGWFGVGRALVTGTGKAFVRPHVFRCEPRSGWHEVPDAVPQLLGKLDLRGGELRRFARWPADLDGDGIRDLVEVADEAVTVRLGRPGPRWPDRPDARLRLAGPLRRWLGLRPVDLDGTPPLELLLLENVPGRRRDGDGEELAEPVLLEIAVPPLPTEEAR